MFVYEAATLTLRLPCWQLCPPDASDIAEFGEEFRGTMPDLRELQWIMDNREVRTVHFEINGIGKAQWEAIATVMREYDCADEVVLNRVLENVPEEDLEAIMGFMYEAFSPSQHLHTLNLSQSYGFGFHPEILCSLIAAFPCIHHLDLQNIGLEAEGATFWAELLDLGKDRLGKIRYLDISSNWMENDGVHGLPDVLEQMKGLRVLKMGRIGIGYAVCESLPFTLPELEELDLAGWTLVRHGAHVAGHARYVPVEQHLSYPSFDQSQDLGRAIQTLQASPKLVVLNLHATNLDSNTAIRLLLSLADSTGTSSLETLDLSANPKIGLPFAAGLLESIHHFPVLSTIDLAGTAFKGEVDPPVIWIKRVMKSDGETRVEDVETLRHRVQTVDLSMSEGLNIGVDDATRSRFKPLWSGLDIESPWLHEGHSPSLPAFEPYLHLINASCLPSLIELKRARHIVTFIEPSFLDRSKHEMRKAFGIANDPKSKAMQRLNAEDNFLRWQTPMRLDEGLLRFERGSAKEWFRESIKELAAGVQRIRLVDQEDVAMLQSLYMDQELHLEMVRGLGLVNQLRVDKQITLSFKQLDWASDLLSRYLYQLKNQSEYQAYLMMARLFSPAVIKSVAVFWEAVDEQGVWDKGRFRALIQSQKPATDAPGSSARKARAPSLSSSPPRLHSES